MNNIFTFEMKRLGDFFTANSSTRLESVHQARPKRLGFEALADTGEHLLASALHALAPLLNLS
jgi:hypothetical protein